MEMKDGDKKKVELELVHGAIQQLLDEKRKHKEEGLDADEDETKLLSKLLTQLESRKEDDKNANREEIISKDFGENDVRIDEIVKEIKMVKRQNKITHCLLSALIIVTAFWQFSEVSMLLAVKEKFSNPLKAVGDMIKGALKVRGNKRLTEPPPVGVPQLPHVDIPALSLNGNDDN
ncbi:hypothetical protein J5N97_007180 [Dioscorea zingiberensis]|uniref:Uncharacterized protein n=1 Tax=Dioscorea zingiberensis TaxID=325984 RepID=A0A9D5DCQ8_9LILI|nr:hypothetical protein J5N97_007180 [Dioscorea zingiberensis]